MAIRRHKKAARDKGLTARYHSGEVEDDRIGRAQKFGRRSKHAQANKTARTAQMRAEAAESAEDFQSLPIGEVIQVFSLYCEVQSDGTSYLCTLRKTLSKVRDTHIVVGDNVRLRPSGTTTEAGQPEAVVEQILPRETVLTRTDSFSSRRQDPVVANADQMLIVASLIKPRIKWGLIDRMLIAAQAGGLVPILCINKMDLLEPGMNDDILARGREILDHYRSMDIPVLETSTLSGSGLDELRTRLHNRRTVLAGHSGVGKSSLIRIIQPALDLKVGDISTYTDKGRHTTTSARRYLLDSGGAVIDTPGVKMFGLWDVTADTLLDYFKDVADESAPSWRQESYERILASLS